MTTRATAPTASEPEPEWEGIPLAGDVPYVGGEVIDAPVPLEVEIVTVGPNGERVTAEERSAQALTTIAHILSAINIKLERLLMAGAAAVPPGYPQAVAAPPVYAPPQPGYQQAPQPAQGGWSVPNGPDPRSSWVCPIHGTGARFVPAGNRKSDGKAYAAFWACTTQGCRERVH